MIYIYLVDRCCCAFAGSWSCPFAYPSISRRISVIHCVLHEEQDSVAVVVVEGIKAGQDMTALILDDDRTITIKANADIPIGHKVAVKDMAEGDTVIKYGTDIGKVVAPIAIGDHAHVHNIKTKRW